MKARRIIGASMVFWRCWYSASQLHVQAVKRKTSLIVLVILYFIKDFIKPPFYKYC